MVVFRTLEQTKSEQCVSAKRILRKHTLDGKLHRLGGLGCHEGIVAGFFQVADVAGVTLPLLLGQLVAGQNSVLAVDDDDVVAAVYVGGKGGLVLASEQHGSLSGNSAEGLAGGVNDIPGALNFGGFC